MKLKLERVLTVLVAGHWHLETCDYRTLQSEQSEYNCEIVKQTNFIFNWSVQTMIWKSNEMGSEVGTSAKETTARLISETTKDSPGGHVSLKP